MSTSQTTYKWIAAWVVFIAILSYVNKTRIGAVLIYWSCVLMLLLLLVTQAPFIARVLQPIGQPVPQGGLPSSNGSQPPLTVTGFQPV